MAMTITIGGITFPTVTAAKEYLRSKLNSYTIGQRIPESDIALWFDVLQKHEWFDEYVEHGIDHFACEMHERYPGKRNMVVVNSEGKKHPFSYQNYLTGEPLSKIKKVKRALRFEIEPQITEYRAGRRGGHVHHEGKPFVQIVDEWLMLNSPLWHALETEAAGVTGYRLKDRDLASDWQAFHRFNARLKLVSVKENLTAGSGGYQIRFVPPILPPPPY